MTEWHLHHAEHGDQPWAVQRAAYEASTGKQYFGWFLEQGLGKTSLALNEFVDLHLNKKVDDVVIVLCPFSFTGDWEQTPAEWGVPWVKGEVWSKKTGYTKPEGYGAWLVAIGFETAKTSARTWITNMLKSRRVMLVLDESLVLGNPSTTATHRFIEYKKMAAYGRALNGTPYSKSVMNYWGQLRFCGGISGVNPVAFRKRYAEMGGFRGKKEIGFRADTKAELMNILGSCTFRALKHDWRKELPPKVHKEVKVEMTPKQRGHYLEMLEVFFTCVQELGVEAQMVLTQMDKLRQLSSCLLMDGKRHTWVEEPKDNPKVKALWETYDSGPSKAVVVHHYRPSGEMLLEYFKSQGVDAVELRGTMDKKQLLDNKMRFNFDPKCRVIVCQQSAAFRGHTLIGGKGDDAASRMLFFENSFSYYERSQIEDRIHRGAQMAVCNYTDFVCSSMESKVLTVLRENLTTAVAIDRVVLAVQEEFTNRRKSYAKQLHGPSTVTRKGGSGVLPRRDQPAGRPGGGRHTRSGKAPARLPAKGYGDLVRGRER